MINIQVFGQQELVDRIKTGNYIHSHCISITNPAAQFNNDPQCETPGEIERAFIKILHLKFWDENDETNLSNVESKKLVERNDIENILQFVEETQDLATGYTIHCWRGIARSTSIALGLFQYFLKDEQAASEALIGIRRNAMPLKRAVLFFDKVLDSNLADFKNTVFRARMKAMREELERR